MLLLQQVNAVSRTRFQLGEATPKHTTNKAHANAQMADHRAHTS